MEQVRKENTTKNGSKVKKQLKKVVKKDGKLPKLSKQMKVRKERSLGWQVPQMNLGRI